MNTPRGFIGAMLEPCESKGQALLTAFFMLVIAGGALAIGYALYLYGDGMRITLLEEQAGEYSIGRKNRSGIYEYMFFGYLGAAIVWLFGALMVVCALIAPVRTLFPRELKKREEVLR